MAPPLLQQGLAFHVVLVIGQPKLIESVVEPDTHIATCTHRSKCGFATVHANMPQLIRNPQMRLLPGCYQ